MPAAYKALYLSPMMPSFRKDETTRFFREVLGFKTEMDAPNYTILSKDNLTLHILNAGVDIGQMEFYLEVNDVDEVWNSMKDNIAGLKVREPFDREYGMREVHIEVPATNTLLFIGSEIKK